MKQLRLFMKENQVLEIKLKNTFKFIIMLFLLPIYVIDYSINTDFYEENN